jgi:GT2 family glycosyltransferase
VARTETLRRLGPFDERIFMYAEDLELGLRARELGVETWFWPRARVLHRRAQSSRRAFGDEPFELLARQRRAVLRERLGPTRARVDDWVQLATLARRVAIRSLLGKPNERFRRELAALRRVRRESPVLGSPG